MRSMVAPLRRVLVRRPAVAGVFAGAGWRIPDRDLLARGGGLKLLVVQQVHHGSGARLVLAGPGRELPPPRPINSLWD